MVISVAALASILHLRLDLSIVLVVFCVGFSTSALVFFAALLASNFSAHSDLRAKRCLPCARWLGARLLVLSFSSYFIIFAVSWVMGRKTGRTTKNVYSCVTVSRSSQIFLCQTKTVCSWMGQNETSSGPLLCRNSTIVPTLRTTRTTTSCCRTCDRLKDRSLPPFHPPNVRPQKIIAGRTDIQANSGGSKRTRS